MSQIKYVSVVEFDDGDRQIRTGRVDQTGSDLAIPTPENDREDFDRRFWKRVEVFSLPEPMPKSEFPKWWNEKKDDDPQPSPIPEVLEAMRAVEEADA